MTDKKDDFSDLDMDEVEGDVKTVEKKTEILVKILDQLIDLKKEPNAKEEQKTKTEEEQILNRLSEHAKKTWIAIPSKGGKEVTVYNVDNCTSEKFFEWLCLVWPPCKTMDHKASDYDDVNIRHNAVINITGFHNIMKFPQTNIG